MPRGVARFSPLHMKPLKFSPQMQSDLRDQLCFIKFSAEELSQGQLTKEQKQNISQIVSGVKNLRDALNI